jgi:acetylornithine aminotransferase
MAKGMGNGFPVGGIIVSPNVKYKMGQLGSTFGGNHMAMAAGLAVLNTIKSDKLIENAQNIGEYLINKLKKLPKVKEIRGRGLMIAVEFEMDDISALRKNLLFEQKLITGHAGTSTIRLLPPLNITKAEADMAYEAILNAINM